MPRLRLTQKQETFCLKYFELGNATEAAIQAGYSFKTARRIASENLSKPDIQSRLGVLRKKAEDAAIGTVIERKKRLTEIYRARLTDFVDDEGNVDITAANNGALAEVTIEEWQSMGDLSRKRIKRVKLLNPVPAIQEHNKWDGEYQSDTVINDNRTINVNVDKVLIDAREKLTGIINRLSERIGEGGGTGETD